MCDLFGGGGGQNITINTPPAPTGGGGSTGGSAPPGFPEPPQFHMPEMPEGSGVDPDLKQAYLDAFYGRLPVPESLEAEINAQRTKLTEYYNRRTPGGAKFSSPGIAALAEFEQRAESLRSEARHGRSTNAAALLQGLAQLEGREQDMALKMAGLEYEAQLAAYKANLDMMRIAAQGGANVPGGGASGGGGSPWSAVAAAAPLGLYALKLWNDGRTATGDNFRLGQTGPYSVVPNQSGETPWWSGGQNNPPFSLLNNDSPSYSPSYNLPSYSPSWYPSDLSISPGYTFDFGGAGAVSSLQNLGDYAFTPSISSDSFLFNDMNFGNFGFDFFGTGWGDYL